MGLMNSDEKKILITLLRQLPYRDQLPVVRLVLLMHIPPDIKDNVIVGDTPITNIINIVDGVDNESLDTPPDGGWPILTLIENALLDVGRAILWRSRA